MKLDELFTVYCLYNNIFKCHCHSTRPQLYWADALEDRIEVSGLDGRDRKQIVEHTTHPFGVAVFESNIYWTNWYNKSIWKSDKRGRHKAQEVRSGLNGALDIRSVSKSRQPNQWSPCMIENGGCSHLCLYKYATYKCECPDKVDSSCTPGNFDIQYPYEYIYFYC